MHVYRTIRIITDLLLLYFNKFLHVRLQLPEEEKALKEHSDKLFDIRNNLQVNGLAVSEKKLMSC